jgi:bacteriorhodopsin
MRKDVETKSEKVKKLYNFLSAYTVIIWCGYPLIWLLYDGFYLIDINTESIMHSVLDIFAKDLFGFILIYNHDLFESHDVVPATASASITLPNSNENTIVPQPPLSNRPALPNQWIP